MSDSEVDKSPISTKRAREASSSEDAEEDHFVDPKQQVMLVEQLQGQYLEEGQPWFLISKNWFNRWRAYCTRMGSADPNTRKLGEQSPPGPIDNDSIIKQGRLMENLVYDVDIYAVPEAAWNEMVQWYGIKSGTEPLCRLVISSDEEKEVEVYPPRFVLYSVETHDSQSISTLTRCPSITLSKKSLISDFLTAVRDAFDLSPSTDVQVWTLNNEPTSTSVPNISAQELNGATKLDIDKEDSPLARSGDFIIAVEVKDKTTHKFPSEETQTKSNDSSSDSSTSSIFANGFGNLTTSSSAASIPRFTRGVCGLQNLGNTCFMNSALQCLSNTGALTKWFVGDNYKRDLNRDNPLGMNGEIAEAYGELVKKLWSGSANSIAPRDFKYTIGRFNSSFSGYQQHDTQELLAFLLDGLHEDLNRIIKKPYILLPDFDGMQDEEIAQKSWDYHRARNDSVIVDLFQGQFKSRLICAECKNVSVTFDPFMYLSLPLPIKKKSKTSIVYVPYDPSQKMQRMVVTLSKEASIAHLQKEVAKMMHVDDPNSLLVAEIFSHKIYKVFAQYEPVATIGSADIIYVYQLPGPVPPVPKKKARYTYSSFSHTDEDDDEKQPVDENQLIVFPVYCATVTKSESSFNSEKVNPFGDPIVLAVPRKDANKPELLYHLLSQHVERYTQFKLFEEVKEDSNNPFEDQVEEREEKDEDVNAIEELTEPPSYDQVVEEEENERDEITEVETIKSEVEDNMDLDTVPEQNLIHTAAAVTAAGGKKIEPMSNLFAMKVFSAPRSYRNTNELLPSIQTWNGLIDLRERAENEEKQRQEYLRQQNESSSDEEELQDKEDTEMEDSLVLPSKMEDEDDEVEDAAALFAPSAGQPDATIDDTNDNDSMENASVHSTNSNGKSDSPLIGPAPPSPPPALPKRKVTCPPSTIIRQGEGIVLEWTPKKARQIFGAARYDDDVCTDAWEDMDDFGDPNEVDLSAQPKKQVTLSDCLDEFTKEEELSEEDLWYCPKCKKHQRATKKFDLWRMPEIMVVHLKRFSHSRTWRDKIDALIDFPTSELDLTDRVLSIEDHDNVKPEDRLIYDLYAVDNHYGGLGGGHYTAFAQNFENKNWYNFDDSHVTKVDVADVKTTAAYLLFYKRRRTLNNDSTRTVEEIMNEVQEKQQAAPQEQQQETEEESTTTIKLDQESELIDELSSTASRSDNEDEDVTKDDLKSSESVKSATD